MKMEIDWGKNGGGMKLVACRLRLTEGNDFPPFEAAIGKAATLKDVLLVIKFAERLISLSVRAEPPLPLPHLSSLNVDAEY